jgi:DNA-binding NarL/FixJ family response regulator
MGSVGRNISYKEFLMVKVLVVDDLPILRESLKFIIEQDPQIEVVGCAENGKEAFELCEKLAPDVVLMDLMMPVCDGVEGTLIIKTRYPFIKVLILTIYGDDENVAQALKNGADGYILKDIEPDKLRRVIKNLADGVAVIQQDVLSTFIQQMDVMESFLVEHKRLIAEFSQKELDIIRLVVEGKNTKEIADCLHFSEGTIRNTISKLLERLQLQDRRQLAVYAMKNKLV